MATKPQEKKLIEIQIPYLYIDPYVFEGELGEITKNINDLPIKLKELETLYPTEFDLSQIEIYKLHIGYGYDGDFELHLRAYRWETDLEFKERIKKQKVTEKKRKETMSLKAKEKEIQDRKLYEELKKRFEDQ